MKRRTGLLWVMVVGVAGMVGGQTMRGEIKLPSLLSDHAVLQRGVPMHLWGWATPGAKLMVGLHEQTMPAVANDRGAWSAWLKPEKAGGPYTLTVDGGSAEGKKQVADVMVGDVWIASGQSNMEMPLQGFGPTTLVKDGDREIAAANNPKLRLMLVGNSSSDVPLADVRGEWSLCTPETASKFSAVAYFFGKEIATNEHVAIGLIDATWGGTPVSSWISMNSLGNNAALLPAFRARATFADAQTDVSAQIAAEKAEDAAALAAGLPKPVHGWHPEEDSWSPAGLYNGMIAPLTGESIKGFLWYQGETDSSHDRAPYYATLFPAMIEDWRAHFQQGNLPFLFVQISSFHSPQEEWGVVRDAQRRTLSVAYTAMAVSLDVGNAENVHPADKQTVGHRLALAAMGLVYGGHVEYGSPLFREATTEPGAMRVWFENASGLHAQGKALEEFEVAGGDLRFVPATARIEGDTIVVSAAAVADPRYVRYGWSNVVTSWFYNAAGLPGSTFTSEREF